MYVVVPLSTIYSKSQQISRLAHTNESFGLSLHETKEKDFVPSKPRRERLGAVVRGVPSLSNFAPSSLFLMYGAMRKRILTKSVISLLFVPMSAAIHAFAWKGLALQLSRIRGGGGGPSSSSYSDVEDNGEPFHEDDVNDEKISYPQHFEEEEEDVVVDAAAVLAMEREDPIASEFVDEITPKRRRTSDIILNLIDKTIGSDEGGENMNHNQKAFLDDLRLLIMERRDGLIQDLNENTQAKEDSQQHHDDPIDGMKRLLHFLAPKIPAIRHSPDVSLAIRSLPSDGDAGLAASLVATLAHLWEIQQLQSTRQQQDRFSGSSSDNATALVAAELVHDRRFEQLLETITCGVHVNKRKKESQALHMPQHGDSSTDNEDDLIQLILQHSEIPDGLSIRDSCRAAWGIAMLGLHDVKVVGEINVPDLILALSLRTRDLVLGHVRLLCQDDFYVESSNTTGTVSVEERIMEIAQEIAEDTATAMWVFGCVQAVTGIKCAPLFHVCSSVLCQDPFQLRNNVQEAIATHEEQPVVGGNDIIDKLDRAERTEHSQSSSLSPNRHRQGKDIFLDWLSPTEVTDVLWALAVYASKDAASTDSMTILSDVAVDRVLEWVAQELQHRGTPVEKGFNSEVRGSEQTKTVELDPQQTPTGLPKRDTENSVDGVERNFANDTSKVDDVTKDFDYVEVVDAAAILAQEQDQVEDISLEDDPMIENLQREDVYSAPVDSEFLMDEIAEVFDPTLLVKREEGLAHDSALNNEQRTDPVTTYLSEKNTIDWLFSAHDLCSLSWAATELGDSLKSRTTQMVSDLLVLMGRGHLAGCSSADYSNLIWAVAKESNEKASPSTPNFITLGRWIAENVYSASGLKDAVIESDSWSLLRHFQPPELSRLLWSLASLSITAEDSHLSSLVGVLSLAGLETASRNSHVFSIEDLARIFWAFVEYSDYDAVLQTNPSSLVSLGRVLGLIDISLSSWEAGDVHPGPKLDEEESKTENEHAKEAFRFTSFFGRARFHITKFERKGEDMQDDLDDYPVPSLLAEKTRLPLLKDFPVDPATLCKLCGSLNRSGTKYSMVCDTHTMAKVILRLMTSRNGRLLRECHVSDLVSLCVTAVSVTSSANREIVGLFSRRAVKLLNEHPSLLDSATPAILIKLIGALGDLGVKYHPEIDSRNAYRRLQLTVRFPFSDDFAYESLSDESLKILVSILC